MFEDIQITFWGEIPKKLCDPVALKIMIQRMHEKPVEKRSHQVRGDILPKNRARVR